jgi:hypothetical protein
MLNILVIFKNMFCNLNMRLINQKDLRDFFRVYDLTSREGKVGTFMST